MFDVPNLVRCYQFGQIFIKRCLMSQIFINLGDGCCAFDNYCTTSTGFVMCIKTQIDSAISSVGIIPRCIVVHFLHNTSHSRSAKGDTFCLAFVLQSLR